MICVVCFRREDYLPQYSAGLELLNRYVFVMNIPFMKHSEFHYHHHHHHHVVVLPKMYMIPICSLILEIKKSRLFPLDMRTPG